MLTIDELQRILARPERAEKVVLTLYLDVDQSKQENLNRGFEKQLKDMLGNVGKTIQESGETKAFEIASQQVEDFVGRYHLRAPGLVLVFDASDGFFWSQELNIPIQNRIRWSREAFVGPLAVAFDEYEGTGIVLLDRANLRLLTMFLGEVEEHIREGFDHRKVRHTKTIGMNHMGSASRAQRKADEQIQLNLRHIAKDMDLMFEQRGIRRIILTGSPEITNQLRSVLPKRVQSHVIGSVELPTTATIDQIRNAAAPLAEKFERHAETAIVTDLVTSAAKSARVVIGLTHTLYALNQRRIWQLVSAAGFHSRGCECPKCAALFCAGTPSCSFCGSAVSPIEDVVERAVDHAVRRGATVEVIRGTEAESSLMNAGGIGAFLRTRTESVLVS
jgi:hypothetical protein